MTDAKKTALLAGASGLVGSELLNILLERPAYGQVKALVRNRLSIEHPKLEQIIVDFDNLGLYKEHFQVDDVYCCLGTTIKKAGSQEAFKKVDFEYPLTMAKLAWESGVQKFLIVTALGADASSKIFYSRVKGEVEAEIKKLSLPSVHIFQPSLLLGDRQEVRRGEKLAAILTPFVNFALVGGLRKYKPILAKDVALAMYLTAEKPLIGSYTYKSDHIYMDARKSESIK